MLYPNYLKKNNKKFWNWISLLLFLYSSTTGTGMLPSWTSRSSCTSSPSSSWADRWYRPCRQTGPEAPWCRSTPCTRHQTRSRWPACSCGGWWAGRQTCWRGCRCGRRSRSGRGTRGSRGSRAPTPTCRRTSTPTQIWDVLKVYLRPYYKEPVQTFFFTFR